MGNYKIFVSDYDDTRGIAVRGKTYENAIQKIKNEINYEEIIKSKTCDPELKDEVKDCIKKIHELTNATWIKFLELFMGKSDLIYFTKFQHGYDSARALKEFCEMFFDGKIVNRHQFEEIQEKLKETNKVKGYEKLKQRLIELAKYLEEDNYNAMV